MKVPNNQFAFPLSRRQFALSVAGAAALAACKDNASNALKKGPVILTSWGFGPGANAQAWPELKNGGSAIDAVEKAINYVENLPDEYYVGYGGSPNIDGETTLDAMIMWGPTHDVGSVGCLKRIKTAISVARSVMEKTQHTLLVGEDATLFARSLGFEETSLTNDQSRTAWEEWKAAGKPSSAWDPEPIGAATDIPGHDTVGCIAIDDRGDICVGCSTNGRAFKLPGRVGDSPITGAGAYCDNDVGAAIATGDGDIMMRFLPSYHAVELMRSGKTPAEATQMAMQRIKDKGYKFEGGIIALSKNGQHGAAKSGWNDGSFGYAVQSLEHSEELKVK